MNVLEMAEKAITEHPHHMTPEEIKAIKLVVSLAKTQIPEYSKIVSRCNALHKDLAMIGGCFTCAKAQECNNECKYKPVAASYYKHVARVQMENNRFSVFYFDKNGRMKKRSGFSSYDLARDWCKNNLNQLACPDSSMVTACNSWEWKGQNKEAV